MSQLQKLRFTLTRLSQARLRTLQLPRRAESRRGVTLVELMISMLILAIICVSWLEIIGVQSARREARRREAVERLAGMMDAFMYLSKTGVITGKAGNYYELDEEWMNGVISFKSGKSGATVSFDSSLSPIGYQLCVLATGSLANKDLFVPSGWNRVGKLWLVGRLYDHDDTLDSTNKPFFELPVFLGY